MFSSNQIFKVSGDFSQLEAALRFALRFNGSNTNNLAYQITKDGKYCIGWYHEKPKDGWNVFPFDFDAEIVSKIIIQHLGKNKTFDDAYENLDGGTEDGFLMKDIPSLFSDEYKGIKQPFYGIVSFEYFKNFYAK